MNRFYDFVERVVDDINERFPGRVFTFTMDNLNVHKNALVMELIIDGGHRVVYRAPYWEVDGAIDYVFNTVHTLIEVLFNHIQNIDDLILVVDYIVSRLHSFCLYFEHVGFNY